MVLMSISGAISANVVEGPWAIIGGIAASATLITYVVVETVVPWWARLKKKKPCEASFNIRDSRRSLSGRDVSQSDPHRVKRLVLPAYAQHEIEIGLVPTIRFHLTEFVFDCG